MHDRILYAVMAQSRSIFPFFIKAPNDDYSTPHGRTKLGTLRSGYEKQPHGD